MSNMSEEKVFVPKPRKGFHLKFNYRFIFFIEESLKKMLFDCRSCGQCILSTTGFVCPMRCPKTLRNGPCGGTQDGMCEVEPTKRCVWSEIFDGVYALDKVEPLRTLQMPMDCRLHETSSIVNWVDNRVDGMHLFLPGKGRALYQIMRIFFHIIKIRWRKFIRPSKYWQKYETHYLGI